MKKKSAGFYAAAITAVLAIVSLVLMFLYKGRGGIVTNAAMTAAIAAIICEAASFLGEKPWTDFTSIAGAACLAFAMMSVLGDGIWNIAESINGIKMVGLPELAGMNYTMAGVGLVSILTALVACFTKKSKEA
ncbi:MAG: hypothetical protein IKQ24_01195 [Verrucomicrobia bacterium]|nr:hypothetical protein [Lachnospiraceae bacterium]MBR4248750.1 hypothetical protein [Verrucomicrobiota bacterium]